VVVDPEASGNSGLRVLLPKIGLSWASVGGGVSRLTTTSRPIETIAAG